MKSISMFAKEEILEYLYKPAEKYLRKRLQDIIKENNQIHGVNSLYGRIIYRGKSHEVDFPYRGVAFTQGNPIDTSLIPRMEKYLVDVEELKQERKEVDRFVSILFANILHPHAIQEVLGESLYTAVSKHLKYYPGTEPNPDEVKAHAIKFKTTITKMQDRAIDNMISRGLYDKDQG